MKSEDLIHLKFDCEEALNSKKIILQSEKNMIRISEKMKNYISLRENELAAKENLHKKVKRMAAILKKLQKISPKVKVPKKLKKESENNKKEFYTKLTEVKRDNKFRSNIDLELREIQEKLNALQR